MAEGTSLLRKHTGLNLYRGFESHRLRQVTKKEATARSLFSFSWQPRGIERMRLQGEEKVSDCLSWPSAAVLVPPPSVLRLRLPQSQSAMQPRHARPGACFAYTRDGRSPLVMRTSHWVRRFALIRRKTPKTMSRPLDGSGTSTVPLNSLTAITTRPGSMNRVPIDTSPRYSCGTPSIPKPATPSVKNSVRLNSVSGSTRNSRSPTTIL